MKAGAAQYLDNRGTGSEIVSIVTENKPIYVMGKWSDPHTLNGCISILVVITTGILERGEVVSAYIDDKRFVHVTFRLA